MKRRTYLKAAVAAVTTASISQAAQAPQARKGQPGVQLHLDATVDLAREKEMLKYFRESFRPAASKQQGFIEVNMLKLRSTVMGTAPGDANYRFVLLFESEELRQKWVATDIHQQVWPAMEKFFKHNNYSVHVFDYPKS
jgi:heme-degrading monooxygenase HmoA